MYTDKQDLVTKNLIEQMETGVVPWQKPWKSGRYKAFPFNATTGNPYHGMNILFLWIAEMRYQRSCNGWMTFHQMRNIDASLIHLPDAGIGKTGQTSVQLFRLDKYIPRRDFIIKGSDIVCRHSGDVKTKKEAERFYYKSFNVFNLDQIQGLPQEMMPPDNTDPLQNASHFLFGKQTMSCMVEDLQYLLEHFPVEVRHGGAQAFFNFESDYIGLPSASDFKSFDDYLATRFHEMIHATGHESRLDRIGLSKSRNKQEHAFEELIAEIGSAFLCAHFGIDGKLQHAAYLKHYIQAIKADTSLIFKAAARAQNAFDTVMLSAPVKKEVAA